MKLIEIPEIDFVTSVPESYREMTGDQVRFVMQRLWDVQHGKISMTEFRVRVLYELARIKRTARSIAWERLHPEAALDRASKVVLMADQLLGFLFTKKGDGQLVPNFDTLVNHLPVIRRGRHRLVGPDEGLLDLSFAELRASNAELLLYSKTKNEAHIDNLIAILYRKCGPLQQSGRRVEPFDPGKTERYARIIRRIPGWQKQLIMLWYSTCVDNLHTGEFTVDGQAICFATLFSGAGGESLGWLSVLYDLAENQTFGDIEKTDATNIVDILTRLYDYKLKADHAKKTDKSD
jgi:hypothetical protein